MPLTDPFDKHFKEYENWFVKNRYVYESELKAIRHFIDPSLKSVEIGVGSGLFSEPLGITEGVEPSNVMADKARERGIVVYKGVAEKLPLDDSTYDQILVVTAICFFDDVDKACSEIYRILKPDGKIVIALVDKDSPLGQIYLRFKDENVFYKPATFYSASEVINRLKRKGFSEIEVIQTVFGTLDEVSNIQNWKNGFGEGGFVIIKGTK